MFSSTTELYFTGLKENLRKAAEMLPLGMMAWQYREQRREAGLKTKMPFEYPVFLAALSSLTRQIGSKIEDYHLISDDRSGRIPTLVLLAWQKNVQQQHGKSSFVDNQDKIKMDGIAASNNFRSNQSEVIRFLKENKERLSRKPNLFVTDYMDYGRSVERIDAAFTAAGLPVPDLAVLSLYNLVGEYQDLFDVRKVYLGEIIPGGLPFVSTSGSKVRGKSGLSGLDVADSKHPKYRPIRLEDEDMYKDREAEQLVRKMAVDFAKKLPIPE